MKIKLNLTFLVILISKIAYCQITFQKNYGDDKDQSGYAVKQCFDGGYIITGNNNNNLTNNWHAFLIRTNSVGDTLWTRTYGNPFQNMVGFDVIQTADSNFVFCGYLGSSSLHLKKIDINGNTMWTSTPPFSWGQAVQQTLDGGFIVTGGSGLVKFSSLGIVQWQSYLAHQGMYIIQLADGSYMASELHHTYNFDSYYLEKISSTGTIIWTKNHGGYVENTSNNNLAQTSDGGFIITGGDLKRLNSNGDTIWTKYFSGHNTISVVQTPDGGFAVGARTYSNTGQMSLIKTDSYGNLQWIKSFGVASFAKSIRQTSDGGFIIAGGITSGPNNSRDVYLVKTDSLGICPTLSISTSLENRSLDQLIKISIYPNPATNILHLNNLDNKPLDGFTIVDILGRKVLEQKENTSQINIEGLNKGIYQLLISSEGKSYTSKLIKE